MFEKHHRTETLLDGVCVVRITLDFQNVVCSMNGSAFKRLISFRKRLMSCVPKVTPFRSKFFFFLRSKHFKNFDSGTKANEIFRTIS